MGWHQDNLGENITGYMFNYAEILFHQSFFMGYLSKKILNRNIVWSNAIGNMLLS